MFKEGALNIYATSWCPHCRKTIEFLDERKVEYNYIDIEKAPEAEVKKVVEVNGGHDWVVPTIEFGGEWREGQFFNGDKLLSDLKTMGVVIE